MVGAVIQALSMACAMGWEILCAMGCAGRPSANLPIDIITIATIIMVTISELTGCPR